MFSHVTLGCNDFDLARPFWQAVMAVLGQPKFVDREGCIAFGRDAGPWTFVVTPYDRESAAPGNGVHVAYMVTSRALVDAFHAAALAHGGTDEGPPGLRPQYHPNYYGAYVRDPDGNKLQAVCHSAGS